MKTILNKITIAIFIFATLFSTSCKQKENHFIGNENYRKQVSQDFAARKAFAENRNAELFSVFNKNISTNEREALEFLFAYMPYSDLADYNGEYFLTQAQGALKTREYFAWGKTIPEDVFLHYVLPYRINNEDLDTARSFIFNEIKDRVKNLSMHDAALEVNHWCHEKATYRGADIRTSSPLATIRTAFGRCGEESTFTVAAMRAVGIPARQCYTPRWAHTDDNHAWVEVWIDGTWHFLGACEPDADLDMGWFARPSTQAMMVHSNAFGKYVGNEEINYESPFYAKINMLKNYTNTKKITVKVNDSNGNAAKNADVKFKLYNYAEYYPIATIKTNDNGNATLTTGLGDLLIWACKDGNYNYAEFDVRKQSEITLQLTRNGGEEYSEDFEMTPPEPIIKKGTVSEEKIAENNRRLQYEDSVRNAYLQTFPKQNDTKKIVNENLSPEQVWNFIHKSEGNYAEIEKFLNDNKTKRENFYLNDFLKSLSDKDLRDTKAETLQQHLTVFDKTKYPLDVYLKGILPARISNEFIRPWRTFLKEKLSATLGDKATAKQVLDWTKSNIAIDDEGNYYGCPISPRGVYELRHSDAHSRNIFFIAACRALNIPAYLDNATNQLFVYENGKWNIVTFEAQQQKTATGKLILTYNQNSELKPQYWTNYTIAKFENGDFVTFDYEGDSRVAKFPATLELEKGYYLISTGNRYSDGTTLSHIDFFNIDDGKTTTKEVVLRALVPRAENYGSIDLQQKIKLASGETSISDLTKNNDLVLAFIDPTREPTKHVFHEMSALKTSFEKWGGNILFVTPSSKRTADFSAAKYNLPKQSQFIYDENSELMNGILSATNQEFRDNYPLIFIVNSKGELTFKTEGYRIGTGNLILKSVRK